MVVVPSPSKQFLSTCIRCVVTSCGNVWRNRGLHQSHLTIHACATARPSNLQYSIAWKRRRAYSVPSRYPGSWRLAFCLQHQRLRYHDYTHICTRLEAHLSTRRAYKREALELLFLPNNQLESECLAPLFRPSSACRTLAYPSSSSF